jgi:hypothetical protein
MVNLNGTQTLTNKTLAFLQTNVITDSTTTGLAATLQSGDIANGIVRLTNASLASVSGIPAGASGQYIVIENQTTGTILINNDDSDASVGNRIFTGSGSPASMPVDSSFLFFYDSIAAHWMLMAGSGSGSGVSFPIGASMSAYLEEPQFQAQMGSIWVLQDGRNVVGSQYTTLTGNTNIPDARGQVLRGCNDGDSLLGTRTDGQQNPDGTLALGAQQSDMFANHDHTINENFAAPLNFSFTNGQPPPTTTGSSITTGVTNFSGGNETRGKNITINHFIMIGTGYPMALVLSPSSVNLPTGGTQTFTASGGVVPYTYSILSGGGTINSMTGFYTAPGSAGPVVIEVTDLASHTATSSVDVYAALQIVPSSITLAVDDTETFTATGGVPPYIYSIASGGGTINTSTGLYTAPGTPGGASVEVTDSVSSHSIALISINAALQIAPTSVNVGISDTTTFTASGGTGSYVYSVIAGGGSVNPSTGVYTAPNTPGSATVEVTDSYGNTSNASVTIVLEITAPYYTGSLYQGGASGVVLTTSGTLTIPPGIFSIQAILGGGGGSGCGDGVSGHTVGNAGGSTIFGGLASIAGGNAGTGANFANAPGGTALGDGGSGGYGTPSGGTSGSGTASSGPAGGASGGSGQTSPSGFGVGGGGAGGAVVPGYTGVGGAGAGGFVTNGQPGGYPSAGGGGGGGNTGDYSAGGGGSSIGTAFQVFSVTPGQMIVVTIGAGGATDTNFAGGGTQGGAGGNGFVWIQL